ncbi:hypothetical protein [Streptomyces sp. NPDC096132]|uniref:hypothetical protein n=1 Tax=Streptomyces sp. NPDC096132 TaxID=3366075 RepID=UPI0037F20293
MNGRILRIELRRSVAPWAGALVLGSALAFLYLISGQWWNGTARWTAQWTPMALWTRCLLIVQWPLVVGLGALQGLRDHRSKMAELLATTPRPARHRAATLAGATAITLVSGFALLVLVGGVQVLAATEYHHIGWLPISLVAALSLVAGAALGMGIARALPSPLTPPVLVVAAFVVLNLLRVSTDEALPTAVLDNRAALLSPAVPEVREAFLTLTGAVHLGQTVWLLGMAATGFALVVAATGRGRLLALTPVVAGAAIALLVLPSDPRGTYVVDEAATARVCDGPVCVTKAHQDRLAQLAGPGRKALSLLHDTLGDSAPTTIRETTALRGIMDSPERSRTAVLVDFDDGAIAGAEGEELTRALLAQGLAPTCWARSALQSGSTGDIAAQDIAAGWVLGDLKPLTGTQHREIDQLEQAEPVWQKLKALPKAEQRSRIAAMHAAAISCEGDAFTVLQGGESR